MKVIAEKLVKVLFENFCHFPEIRHDSFHDFSYF